MGQFLQAMQQGGQQSSAGQPMGTGNNQNSGMTGQGQLPGTSQQPNNQMPSSGQQGQQQNMLLQLLAHAMQQQAMKSPAIQSMGQSQSSLPQPNQQASGNPNMDPNGISANDVQYGPPPMPMGAGNAGYGMSQGYQGANNGNGYPLIG